MKIQRVVLALCIMIMAIAGGALYYGAAHRSAQALPGAHAVAKSPRRDVRAAPAYRSPKELVAAAPERPSPETSASPSGAVVDDPRPASAAIIEHGPRSSRAVALTFDLCEAEHGRAGFDRRIMQILTEKGARATFFMGGKWAESHPDAARQLAANPLFEIANHSYSHKTFTKIPDDEAREQVEKAQESIGKITGVTPRYFRFPAGSYAPRHLALVAGCGLQAVQWDVVTGDPDKHISAADIIGVVKRKARGGSIVIMHANGRGWHTAEALPTVIELLRSKGYELVTIPELLQD